MKVLHISPFYFGLDSVIGGGERYAHELALAMSEKTETVFLSFSPDACTKNRGKLRIELIPGIWTPAFFKWLAWADVVHCHQVRFSHTDIALLAGKLMGKKIFVTDLGGGQAKALSDHFPVLKLADGFLLISEYSRKIWLETHPEFSQKSFIIGGGVDSEKFQPGTRPKTRNLVFAGRIVSHKGIDILIEALDEDMSLEMIGKVYEPAYFEYLKEKARSKRVVFLNALSDEDLTSKYQQAAAVIQPSVYKNYRGDETRIPELFGLVAVEAMACAAPVIVSDAASLPELVRNGETGFVVPVSDPAALKEKIRFILDHPEESLRMGQRARQEVLMKFSWKTVVERCLKCYANGGVL